ncbi:MAG: S-layer homology domain-containing protein, partial [Clostridia bacterium]|nr:S-layer homology domain-containing protein [Clostridia bacterium]
PINYTVQNCIFSWIGGSVQSYNKQLRPTRLGNAVEAWKNVNNFTIDHCLAYQVFDCAWTTQWEGDSNGESVIMEDINITNNVAMYTNTGLEIWNTPHIQYENTEFPIRNLKMSGNYNLYMGYGMTSDRTADKKDANLIFGTTSNGKNNSVDNNVLLFSNHQIFASQSIGKNTYNFHDNVYIVNSNIYLGKIRKLTGEDKGGQIKPKLSRESVGELVLSGADAGSKYYVVPLENFYEVPEYSPASEADRFVDVPAGFWGRDYIDYVVFNEYYNGVSEDRFAPNEPMTRAMAVTVLMRMANGRIKDTADIPFTDINAGTWYENSVKWAYLSGIVSHSDKFRPDDKITRAELAEMMLRYARSIKEINIDTQTSFTDIKDLEKDQLEGILFCASNGIINGYEDGSVRANNSATRTEVAAMMKRLKEFLL